MKIYEFCSFSDRNAAFQSLSKFINFNFLKVTLWRQINSKNMKLKQGCECEICLMNQNKSEENEEITCKWLFISEVSSIYLASLYNLFIISLNPLNILHI